LKSYLITDPKYYSKDSLYKSIKKYNPDFLCFRDKENYSSQKAKEFLEIVKNENKIAFLNSYYEDAIQLNFDGVHLSSSQLDLIDSLKDQLLLFASTHNLEEVEKAKNANFITFSPIFYSKNREGLGVEKLIEVSKIAKPKVFGLGGIIDKNQVKELEKAGAYGFASIRYFV
jgi:thiamine-phosphate pyrophosphorylase